MIISLKIAKIILVFSLFSFLFGCSEEPAEAATSIKIAMPYQQEISNGISDYYFSYLEDVSGLEIELVFMHDMYDDEYTNMLLTSLNTDIDAVFFTDKYRPTPEEIKSAGMEGHIIPLNSLIESESVYFKEALEKYNIKKNITASDSNIYYLPSIDNLTTTQHIQTLWVNIDWLSKVGATLPQTTSEFTEMLAKFKEYCPSGAPIIGSSEEELFAPNFIMNSFEICDPQSYYIAINEGKLYYPPMTDNWREGLKYLNSLYENELLLEENLTYSEAELISICNDPSDYVGAFTSQGLSDIISENSPELMSNFLAVTPLKSDMGDGTAILDLTPHTVGGVILSTSDNKEEVFKLMDIMCSEEAFLSGHFGEEGSDWKFSEVGEISASGETALITVTSESLLEREIHTAFEIGPYITVPEYADRIAYRGYQVNQSEYVDVRVRRMYGEYIHNEGLNPIVFSEDNTELAKQLTSLVSYTKQSMISFINGDKDASSDEDWQLYLDGFSQHNPEELMKKLEDEFGRRD